MDPGPSQGAETSEPSVTFRDLAASFVRYLELRLQQITGEYLTQTSGMLVEAIHSRQVIRIDSGCALSGLCAEFGAVRTPRPVAV